MKTKLIAGLLLGGILVYLSVRGIDFQDVAKNLRGIDGGYLLPALILMAAMQWLRSVRWGILLSPLEKVNQLSLFSVSNVGFLAIMAIPARLGELARPYLITQHSRIAMSSALGTIVVERILDVLTVLLIAVFVLVLTPAPPWMSRASGLLLFATTAATLLLVLMILWRSALEKKAERLAGRLPEKYASGALRLLHHFIDGFQAMADRRSILYASGLSLVIWLVDVLIIYLMFLSFHYQLPVSAAFVVMIILIVGIAIPAAPGFVGNWHYFCVLALTLYGISKPDALSFAIVYHFLSLVIVVALGVASLPFQRFTLADLRRQMTQTR
jgi:uncharacterized protein (TIRG00374 family)